MKTPQKTQYRGSIYQVNKTQLGETHFLQHVIQHFNIIYFTGLLQHFHMCLCLCSSLLVVTSSLCRSRFSAHRWLSGSPGCCHAGRSFFHQGCTSLSCVGTARLVGLHLAPLCQAAPRSPVSGLHVSPPLVTPDLRYCLPADLPLYLVPLHQSFHDRADIPSGQAHSVPSVLSWLQCPV